MLSACVYVCVTTQPLRALVAPTHALLLHLHPQSKSQPQMESGNFPWLSPVSHIYPHSHVFAFILLLFASSDGDQKSLFTERCWLGDTEARTRRRKRGEWMRTLFTAAKQEHRGDKTWRIKGAEREEREALERMREVMIDWQSKGESMWFMLVVQVTDLEIWEKKGLERTQQVSKRGNKRN